MIKRIKYNPKNKKRWLELRQQLSGKNTPDVWRHGSSDVATIMGMNPYMSQTEYFYHCVDWIDATPHKNLAMYRGESQEQLIFNEYWKFWNPENPSTEAFLENVYGDRKIYRKGRLYNYTITNTKYPYAYSNPDFQIYKNQYTPSGLVEMKSATYRSTNKYESGLPPMYIFQAYHQMMLCEVEYVEVFILVDSTYPELFPLEYNKSMIERIDEETRSFGDLVLRGKEIVYATDIPLLEREQMLAEIAPEHDGSDNLTDFYTEQHKKKVQSQTVDGTQEQLSKVLAYLELKYKKVKPLEREAKKLEQDIRSWFYDGIGAISFGEDIGEVSYYGRFNCPFRIYQNYNA